MSDLVGIPVIFMRGGTSRGPYFKAEDLPQDTATRDRVLLAAMGSPDPRQIDGLGGADTLTSKVAIVSKSTRPGVDVDRRAAAARGAGLGGAAAPEEPPSEEQPLAEEPESGEQETPTPPEEGKFFDQESDDVLEETPDFLQDTPEHDRLWFEQKPPKDFDFDD